VGDIVKLQNDPQNGQSFDFYGVRYVYQPRNDTFAPRLFVPKEPKRKPRRRASEEHFESISGASVESDGLSIVEAEKRLSDLGSNTVFKPSVPSFWNE
jgi:hypothetical protein